MKEEVPRSTADAIAQQLLKVAASATAAETATGSATAQPSIAKKAAQVDLQIEALELAAAQLRERRQKALQALE